MYIVQHNLTRAFYVIYFIGPEGEQNMPPQKMPH